MRLILSAALVMVVGGTANAADRRQAVVFCNVYTGKCADSLDRLDLGSAQSGSKSQAPNAFVMTPAPLTERDLDNAERGVSILSTAAGFIPGAGPIVSTLICTGGNLSISEQRDRLQGFRWTERDRQNNFGNTLTDCLPVIGSFKAAGEAFQAGDVGRGLFSLSGLAGYGIKGSASTAFSVSHSVVSSIPSQPQAQSGKNAHAQHQPKKQVQAQQPKKKQAQN